MMPSGICGVISSSISFARSSSVLTPSARHIRSVDPYRLVTAAMSNPAGFSNSSAGPPPGSLHARSVTAAISRSGLTGSDTRASSRRLSRSDRKSVRSEYMRLRRRRHFIDDLGREGEGPSPGIAGDARLAFPGDCGNEVGEFELQWLLDVNGDVTPLDRWCGSGTGFETPALDLLCGVVDRHVRRGLEEADLADPIAADTAGGEIRDAAVREAEPHVGDVDPRRNHRDAHRLERRHVGTDDREYDVQVVNHQVEDDVDVEAALGKGAQPVDLDEARVG